MKTTLVLVGKTNNTHLVALIDDYLQRIRRYQSFSVITLPDIKKTKSLSQEEQKEMEGEIILQHLPPTARIILLDEHGQTFTSVRFADYLMKKQTSYHEIVFVIGGAYGFSQSVYKRANELLSLSEMTFSHQMIRLLFVEQFYRALTIYNNHPYHHQ